MKFLNAILTIAYRDVMKFFRDRARIVGTFIFPFIFIGILGNSFQSTAGQQLGFNYLTFTFTGILAQTLFQSSASGIISLIEDRENDFSQEIFVSPISRYSIIVGKILGESSVAVLQAVGVIVFGFIIGASISIAQVIILIPIMIVACLFGASFGVLVLSNIPSQRVANLFFPFIMFPQFFLSGVFTPLHNLPWYLDVLSKIAPMTYIVDLLRGIYYAGTPEFSKVVSQPVWLNLLVITVMTIVFIAVGTWLFVRNEKNK